MKRVLGQARMTELSNCLALTRQFAALADRLNSSLSLPSLQSDLKRALPNVEEIQNDLQQLQQLEQPEGPANED